jgi:hypothetical protein
VLQKGDSRRSFEIPIPYGGAHPKSFTDLRKNRPAHVEESSQRRRLLPMIVLGGWAMTIYLAATALAGLISWVVLGLLLQEI